MKCVQPPLLGVQTIPFSVFSNLQKNYSAHEKYAELKVVDLKELISGNFYLRTISRQITNLRFLKSFVFAKKSESRNILTYSIGGLVEIHGMTISFIDIDHTPDHRPDDHA